MEIWNPESGNRKLETGNQKPESEIRNPQIKANKVLQIDENNFA